MAKIKDIFPVFIGVMRNNLCYPAIMSKSAYLNAIG